MNLSFSTLSIPCPVSQYKALNGMQRENVSSEEGEAGVRIHKILFQALETNKWTEYQELDLPIATELETFAFDKREFETGFKIPIGNNFLTGRIDVKMTLDNQIFLVDVKSGFSTTPTADNRKQLKMYALSQLVDNPMAQITSYLFYSRWNILKSVAEYSIDNIEQLKTECQQDIDNALVTKDTPLEKLKPQATTYCRYCAYCVSCNAYTLQTEDTIEKIAEKYLTMKAKLENLEGVLKDYVDANGNITAMDKVIGYQASTKTEVSPDIFKYAIEKGIFDKVVKADVMKIKKLAKTNPELANFLHTEVGSPRFTVITKGEKDE